MSPRGRKPGTKVTKEPNTLLEALKFISVAQRANGAPETTHCRLSQNWIMASNGILSAAHKIQESIECCPHTYSLIDALEAAPGPVNLTHLSNGLSVRSGEFSVLVPCLEASNLPTVMPDAQMGICDDRLKQAVQSVGILAAESGQKLVNASIQLRGQTALASDGNVILEAFHGISLPPLYIVPKTFATALSRPTVPIEKAGGSEDSLTLWYADGSWLKTQVYSPSSELPDLYRWLNLPATPVPVPKELFTVAKLLAPFSGDGKLYSTKDGMKVNGMAPAVNSLKHMPIGIALSIKSLLQIAPYCNTIHFLAAEGISLFFGDGVRGCISTERFEE
jgi:hypothetical protein